MEMVHNGIPDFQINGHWKRSSISQTFWKSWSSAMSDWFWQI